MWWISKKIKIVKILLIEDDKKKNVILRQDLSIKIVGVVVMITLNMITQNM